MSSSQILQGLLSIPARSRQQIGNWRNRVSSAGLMYMATKDKAKQGQILRNSLRIHQPVWATAGGATYTTAGAVYLTLRYLRRLR